MKNKTGPKGRTAARILLILGLLAGLAGPARPEERSIALGRQDGWRELAGLVRLEKVAGRFGDLDLVLQEAEYEPAGDTDLLLHFNERLGPQAGAYRVLSDGSLLSSQVRRLGAASAGFQRRGLVLAPGPLSLLRRGNRWDDFSIELWIYPLLLNDGEVVLAWSGSDRRGTGSPDSAATPQRLQAVFHGRKLQWSFQNLFAEPEGGRVAAVPLAGITPLVPRVWHHHLLRFDGQRGLLEYLVDGVSEAVTYVTTTGGDGGAVCLPSVGEAGPSTLTVAESFTGFLDELRVSRRFVIEPALSSYALRTGSAWSRLLDLGYTGTRVRRIEARTRTPGDTAVSLFYRLTDEWRPEWQAPRSGGEGLRPQPGEGWAQLPPGRDLPDARGRYLQLWVELFPDGGGSLSPEVSDLAVVYEQDLPPVPPADLRAAPGDGQITLTWKRVNEPDVRGYRVYYGESPGWYHGAGAAEGPSPVTILDGTRLTLTGLQNDRLYYFAVVSLDGTDPPHLSAFSREISARPSGLFR